MERFDILDRRLSPFGNFFLEASAGTGKTFTIEHLVLRLLIDPKHPLRIEEILVMTFTRAATRELKERIRSNMEEALSQLKQKSSSFDYLQAICEQGERAVQVSVDKIEEALLSFDQAGIYTIHGFCHRMLQQFAFEANVPFDLSGPDEEQHRSSMRQAITDLFRSSSLFSAEQLELLLKKHRNQVDRIVERVVALVENEYSFTEIAPINGETKDPAHLLLALARESKTRWEKVFQEEERFAPDRLLHKMLEALEMPLFLMRVRGQFKGVIIDEFQDTDPIQWQIFRRLFLNHAAAFYLVGDPKQSIYAFRSADVYTYLEAALALGEERRFSLDTNYRSTPELIGALNRLFARPGWLHLPKEKQTLHCPEVKARPHASQSKNSTLHFFIAEGEIGRAKSWPTQEMEQTMLFPFIASKIHEEMIASKTRPEEIAVLVKDRFQAQRLHAYLKRTGLPASVIRAQNMEESPALYDLIALLEAALAPHDTSKLKRSLATTLIGWSAEELQGGLERSELLQAKERFLFLSSLLKKEGFAPFFHAFLKTFSGLNLTPDLMHLAEILTEEQAAALLKPEQLIAYLKEIPSKEEIKRRREEGEKAVAILTMHMSKGLEYEVVFALGLASRHMNDEEWLVVQDQLKRKIIVKEGKDEENQVSIEERDAEKMRQLYVAMTRAKRALYVPVLFDRKERSLRPGHASPMELFAASIAAPLTIDTFTAALEKLKQESAVDYSFCPAMSAPYYVAEDEEEEPSSPVPQFPSVKPSLILSFTSLASETEIEYVKKEKSDALVRSRHTLPQGAVTGVVIHDLLEQIFGQKSSADTIKELIRKRAARTSLEGWEEVLYEMILDALGPWCSSAGIFLQEMEFLFPEGGHYYKGFIDLVLERDGKYFLIDWKSNWLGPRSESYNQESVEKTMREHDYYFQAALYADALRRYLALVEPRPFEECFGGAYYIFLRAPFTYHFMPDWKNLHQRLL